MKRYMVMGMSTEKEKAEMAKMTPEERQANMKKWMAWKEIMGDKLLDMGAPLYNGFRLIGDKESNKESDIAGYMMIKAENKEKVIEYLKLSPLGENNQTVEAFEIMDM